MIIKFTGFLILVLSLVACNSSRVKETTAVSFTSVAKNCIPITKLSPDVIQGPKKLFLPITMQRAKEIVFDSSAPFGYRAPHTRKMSIRFNAYLRYSDRRVKFNKRADNKMKILLTETQNSGRAGVTIQMASRQIGGLSTYSYVGNILKTAHCLYNKIDLLKPVKLPITRSGKKISVRKSTMVRVRITRALSSRVSRNDDRIEFIVLQDVRVSGVVIIRKGTRAIGKVVDRKGAKMLGFSGKIGFSIDSVLATNGQKIRLAFSKKASAKNRSGQAAFRYIMGSPLYLISGHQAAIEAGRDFIALVAEQKSLQY